jgi:hypothetical protein
MLLLPALLPLRAQERSLTQQGLYWVRYANTLELSPDWSVLTEVEDRRFMTDNRQHQWVLPRVTGYYTGVSGLKLGLGGTYFRQALPHDGGTEVAVVNPEWRPHADVIQTPRTGKLRWTNRLRVEGRFFGREAEGGGRDWIYNTRFRWLLQAAVPLTPSDAKVSLKAKVFDEVMVQFGTNVGVNVFDQNRIGGGLGVGLSPAISLDADYMWWYQQRSTGFEYWSRHIVRFSVKHKISLGQ